MEFSRKPVWIICIFKFVRSRMKKIAFPDYFHGCIDRATVGERLNWIWLSKHWSRPIKKKLRRVWQNNSDFDISFFLFSIKWMFSIMNEYSILAVFFICWTDKHLYILTLRFCSFFNFFFLLVFLSAFFH